MQKGATLPVPGVSEMENRIMRALLSVFSVSEKCLGPDIASGHLSVVPSSNRQTGERVNSTVTFYPQVEINLMVKMFTLLLLSLTSLPPFPPCTLKTHLL